MRYANVPVILQKTQMSCWHASARMLWAFKYRSSINFMGATYTANRGILPRQFVTLARTLGLESTQRIRTSYSWRALADLLRDHGPLWAAGQWYGPNHIIVITGVEPDGTLYVNDPGNGARVHNMAFFNDKIDKNVSSPLMYLPNSRANSGGYQSYIGR